MSKRKLGFVVLAIMIVGALVPALLAPRMAEAEYREIIRYLGDLGYDVSRIEKVPQRW